MPRTPFAVMLLWVWVLACRDQTNVTEPGQPDDAGPSVDPAELAPDFDLRALNAARTALSGGATTVFDASPDAFSQPAPNLRGESLERHDTGDEEFEVEFDPNTGLGPVFDNVSCEACHEGDGRGRPPAGGEPFSSMLFRASVPGTGPHGSPAPVPDFGTQLQLRAIAGFSPEIQAAIAYAESVSTFADGTKFELRVPRYALTGVDQTLPADVLFSPRVAPAVFGLGLLEAVPEADVRALADERDRNRDGISGRPNVVWDERAGRTALGRFGWKANTPTLVQQTAGAYNGDMGVTSPLFPSEPCEGTHPKCAPHPPEVDDQTVEDVAFYTQTLAVPARRDLDDSKTRQGERLFYASGCDGCHAPTLRTGTLPGIPEVSNQVIHPYTDLLLHDMGPALADDRPDFLASGREWRTPPLWGIGLVETVNGHTNLLHDGRARTLLEAVLWHGGEAQAARDRVLDFSADEREALIAFLESL